MQIALKCTLNEKQMQTRQATGTEMYTFIKEKFPLVLIA
jgi:hypothetical protein